MSTCIIYYSKHHGNTKKLLDAIKAEDPKVELIDVTEKREVDLNGYDRIGFASGIYYTKFAEQVLTFAKVNLPPQKDVFYLATAGNPMNYPHRLCVGKGFCYAAWRHEPARCSMHPAEQGMSTMPLSHWLTFGNTFLKIFAAPFMSAFVIVPS